MALTLGITSSLILKQYHLWISFKDILSLVRPEKKGIFGIHDPSGLRILFQLRVGLSTLIYHKKRHKFIDTPSDNCCCNHGPEDINHFFFFRVHSILLVEQR